MTSAGKHLIFRNRAPPTKKALAFVHTWRNGWLINEMGHLGCFAGGNLVLGGRHLGLDHVVALGLDLVETCRAVYDATATGIGPESWMWRPTRHHGSFSPRDPGHVRQADKLGWWIVDARYMLRPGRFWREAPVP